MLFLFLTRFHHHREQVLLFVFVAPGLLAEAFLLLRVEEGHGVAGFFGGEVPLAVVGGQLLLEALSRSSHVV